MLGYLKSKALGLWMRVREWGEVEEVVLCLNLRHGMASEQWAIVDAMIQGHSELPILYWKWKWSCDHDARISMNASWELAGPQQTQRTAVDATNVLKA